MAEAQITITVEKLSQDGVDKIKQALERINGVERVVVHLENKKIYIEFDDEKITEQLIGETIEDEGFKLK